MCRESEVRAHFVVTNMIVNLSLCSAFCSSWLCITFFSSLPYLHLLSIPVLKVALSDVHLFVSIVTIRKFQWCFSPLFFPYKQKKMTVVCSD